MTKTFHFYIVFILICCFSIGVFSCKSLKSDKRANKKKEPINKDLLTYDELNKVGTLSQLLANNPLLKEKIDKEILTYFDKIEGFLSTSPSEIKSYPRILKT